MSRFRRSLLAAVIGPALALSVTPVNAETILGALAKAYQNNSSLNSQRAGVRVTDEDVAIAKSGYRPTIAGQASAGVQAQDGTEIRTGSFGVSIQQSLFDGFQTRNNVNAANARVQASVEGLRNTEQDTLFNAASTYMDVIRDRRIATLREQNLDFLQEQVRAADSRFDVGEGTRTDVAQAQASRSLAIAQLSAARAQVTASAAVYHQIIGNDPGSLDMPRPLANLLPRSLDEAFAIAASEHPAILAQQHLVDAANFAVNSAEGSLLPQVSASAGVSRSYTDLPGVSGSASGTREGTSDSANIGVSVTVPLYQGGLASAQVRQAKESLGQARIDVDVTRDSVRQILASAWTQFEAARETVQANREQVDAAQLALDGVIEERNVGQRTTLDVLNAQADVINAQVTLASAERDVVVASYAILSAMGRLSPTRLGLDVALHHPEEHYNAVKDKWYGLRTPDGR